MARHLASTHGTGKNAALIGRQRLDELTKLLLLLFPGVVTAAVDLLEAVAHLLWQLLKAGWRRDLVEDLVRHAGHDLVDLLLLLHEVQAHVRVDGLKLSDCVGRKDPLQLWWH